MSSVVSMTSTKRKKKIGLKKLDMLDNEEEMTNESRRSYEEEAHLEYSEEPDPPYSHEKAGN
jgi:hypothetical protein